MKGGPSGPPFINATSSQWSSLLMRILEILRILRILEILRILKILTFTSREMDNSYGAAAIGREYFPCGAAASSRLR